LREWAFFRHRLNLSTDEFLSATPDSLRALSHSFQEEKELQDRRQASLMCLIFNLLRPAKARARSVEDFMPQKAESVKPKKTENQIFSIFDKLTKDVKNG
jgi:hypothetical protein